MLYREVGGGTYRAVHQAAARGRFISEPVTKELAETDRQKEPKVVARKLNSSLDNVA